MNGDNDKTKRDGPSDGKASGSVNLSSYLKEKAPTMSRILQEEEARTAALAAGNGAGDEPDLDFIAPETKEAETEDDPFVIMEEESFDISFDNLGEDADQGETGELDEDLDDFDLDAVALEVEAGSRTLSLDDGAEADGEEEDLDLGPPLPDLSAFDADSDAGTDPEDDEDLPEIDFVDDGEVAAEPAGEPELPPDALAAALPETPESAKPLNLSDFDAGLDIAFADDDEEEPAPVVQEPPEQEIDPQEATPNEATPHEATGAAPVEPVAMAPEPAAQEEDDLPNIELVDAEDLAAPEADLPAPADEFAAWDDGEDGKVADLGPPLPDLSAPEETASDESEPMAARRDEDGEEEEEEEELTLEIEGLEFRPGDTIDESTVVVEAAAAAAEKPMPETETPAGAKTETAPESAPGVAEAARPVTVQEALMAAIELHRVGDLEGAALGYEMLVRRYPNSAAGWINLGIVLRRMGKLDASLVCLRRGVMLNPRDGAAWSNLGNALRAANYLEDAKRAQIKAISLTPGAAQIHYNMGLVTRDFGDLVDADSCFRRAELLGYTNPDLAWDRSLNLLLSGNLEEGFAAYEARWNLPDTAQRYADLPRWQGDMQKDKTVVIHAEQGLGDSLQFCRYVPTLKSRVGKLIFEVQPQLADLLGASPWFRGVDIHAREQASVAADMQMPLLSTPILLPLGESVLPGRDPYLTPPANGPRIREGLPGPRIGIAWAGKPTHKNDANRSTGLSAFTALFDVLNVRFYSLQVGPTQTQIRNLALNSVIQDLSPAIRSFADTASLLQDIDLVVTVDTSVAHLAGAMGKQVWVVLPFAPDWRWQLRRQDSPWYPSMRLFRQSRPGDWDSVFMQLRGALDDWLDARPEKPAS